MSNEIPRFIADARRVDLAVIIVSYRSAADLPLLIASLRNDDCPGLSVRVIVVDNDSDDGSADVAAALGDTVVIRSGGNLGYAGGINVASAYIGDADEILVLNPDLVVLPGLIQALRMRRRISGASIVVPKILDADGEVFPSLRREPGVLRLLGDTLLGRHLPARSGHLSEGLRSPSDYTSARPIHWATGAAMLVDRVTWDAVGLWDEQFFLYSEETDFFRRARDLGFTAWFEPSAVVRHRQGGSGASQELVALLMVNRVRYMMKHQPRLAGVYRAVLVLHEQLRRSDTSHDLARWMLRRPWQWHTLPQAQFSSPSFDDFPPASLIILSDAPVEAIQRTVHVVERLIDEELLDVVVVRYACPADGQQRLNLHPRVLVRQTSESSIAAAMTIGDHAAVRWPRLYLAANVTVTVEAIGAVVRALALEDCDAARPSVVADSASSSWVVRSYLRAYSRATWACGQTLPGLCFQGLNRRGSDRLSWPEEDDEAERPARPFRLRVLGGPALTAEAPHSLVGLLDVLATLPPTVVQVLGGGPVSVREVAAAAHSPSNVVDVLVFATVTAIARLRQRGSTTPALLDTDNRHDHNDKEF